MLINPLPYAEDLQQPLNSKPWPNMSKGSDLLNLVDADIFTYAAGFAVEHCEYMAYNTAGKLIGHWKGKSDYNKWKKKNFDIEHELDWAEWIEPLEKSLFIVNRKQKQIRDVTHGAKQKWYLTKGSTLWRNDDATIQGYKDNRKEMRKPKYYDDLREHMIKRMRAKMCEGLEADDSVAATARNNPGEVIITSGDKDLRTIAGLHLNPSKLKDGIEFVSELEACRFIYIQMLTGDKIDNIKGLSGTRQAPGWGPVKAGNAINQFITEYDMAKYVAQQYKATHPAGCININDEHMTWEEMLVETANLLFLRRYRNTKFKWGE